MRIIVSHPTGNTFVRSLLCYLNKLTLLDCFFTTISWSESSKLNKLLPTTLKRILTRRSFPIANNSIDTYSFREICRLLLGNRLSRFKLFEQSFGINNIYRTFDKFVSEQLLLKDFTHIH